MPTSFHNGSYQLRDTDGWQQAKLLYNERELLVSDADHKPKEPLVYPAAKVRAFVIGRDTFEVVHNLALPKPEQHLTDAFVRRLYRRGGYQVAEYVAYLPKPEPALSYKLLYRPGAAVILLPPNPRQFRMTLATAVTDYPQLSHQLELDPSILPEQLPDLLNAYERWKATQPAKADAKL